MLVITDRLVLLAPWAKLCNQLSEITLSHFHNNKFLSHKQFGFIKGHSTTIQLLHIRDNTWTEYLEQGGQIDVIYTDLEKAFENIPHKRLISKLFRYGLNNEITGYRKTSDRSRAPDRRRALHACPAYRGSDSLVLIEGGPQLEAGSRIQAGGGASSV